ncbi:hypothetical protein Glove_478g27 [Diversispora epigaea]|uniref:Uncharacterized protein n=1 Tax=Diversispora epigaea TaxID=1348612 RepID=A0A397GKP6_9GLOM|nr:hypothetical protein Glove_478g27 [Diversispora epigaea]
MLSPVTFHLITNLLHHSITIRDTSATISDLLRKRKRRKREGSGKRKGRRRKRIKGSDNYDDNNNNDETIFNFLTSSQIVCEGHPTKKFHKLLVESFLRSPEGNCLYLVN